MTPPRVVVSVAAFALIKLSLHSQTLVLAAFLHSGKSFTSGRTSLLSEQQDRNGVNVNVATSAFDLGLGLDLDSNTTNNADGEMTTLEALQWQISKADSKCAELSTELVARTATIKDLQEELKNKDETLKLALVQIQNLQVDATKSLVKLTELKKNKEVDADREKTRTEMDQILLKVEQLEHSLETAEDSNKGKQQELHNITNALNDANTELDDAWATVQSLRIDMTENSLVTNVEPNAAPKPGTDTNANNGIFDNTKNKSEEEEQNFLQNLTKKKKEVAEKHAETISQAKQKELEAVKEAEALSEAKAKEQKKVIAKPKSTETTEFPILNQTNALPNATLELDTAINTKTNDKSEMKPTFLQILAKKKKEAAEKHAKTISQAKEKELEAVKEAEAVSEAKAKEQEKVIAKPKSTEITEFPILNQTNALPNAALELDTATNTKTNDKSEMKPTFLQNLAKKKKEAAEKHAETISQAKEKELEAVKEAEAVSEAKAKEQEKVIAKPKSTEITEFPILNQTNALPNATLELDTTINTKTNDKSEMKPNFLQILAKKKKEAAEKHAETISQAKEKELEAVKEAEAVSEAKAKEQEKVIAKPKSTEITEFPILNQTNALPNATLEFDTATNTETNDKSEMKPNFLQILIQKKEDAAEKHAETISKAKEKEVEAIKEAEALSEAKAKEQKKIIAKPKSTGITEYPILNQWELLENGGIKGIVDNHPDIKNGDMVLTSPLTNTNAASDDSVVRTMSGSYYRLGKNKYTGFIAIRPDGKRNTKLRLTGQTLGSDSDGCRYLLAGKGKENSNKRSVVWTAYRADHDGKTAVGEALIAKVSSNIEAMERESDNYKLVTGGRRRDMFVNQIEYLPIAGTSIRFSNKCALVMERGTEDLKEYLQRTNEGLDVTAMKDAATSAAKCIEAIHSSRLVWTDLKVENFVLTEEIESSVRVKAIDLESAISVRGNPVDYSPEGCPPEFARMLLEGDAAEFVLDYNFDIWSYGMFLYELSTGRSYFDGKTPFQITQMLPTFEPTVEHVPDKQLADLIKQCLDLDPKKRPSISKILRHSYLMTKDSGPFSFLFQ